MAYSTLRALDDPGDLQRYLDLRAERARIDDELATLAPVILDALEREDGGRLDVQGLTLEARTKRTYAYSDEVVETEAYLKDLRAAERSNGTAYVTTATGYVRVSVNRVAATNRARASIASAERVFSTL